MWVMAATVEAIRDPTEQKKTDNSLRSYMAENNHLNHNTGKDHSTKKRLSIRYNRDSKQPTHALYARLYSNPMPDTGCRCSI
jgi:hypothetical protein